MDKTAKEIKDGMIGARYNRLVISKCLGVVGGHKRYECMCDCGGKTTAQLFDLKSNNTRSCGCLQRETASKNSFRHGGYIDKKPEYRIYTAIKSRCYNPNSKGYQWYGALGVSMSDDWKSDFNNFFNDMGKRPSASLSVERIDVSKGYEASNCYWADIETQANNKRDTVRITYNGETKSATQWARQYGVNTKVLRSRLSNGIKFEDAVLKPQFTKSKLVIDLNLAQSLLNEGLPIQRIAKRFNVDSSTISSRISKGLLKK